MEVQVLGRNSMSGDSFDFAWTAAEDAKARTMRREGKSMMVCVEMWHEGDGEWGLGSVFV